MPLYVKLEKKLDHASKCIYVVFNPSFKSFDKKAKIQVTCTFKILFVQF